jgi:hypothetical protein
VLVVLPGDRREVKERHGAPRVHKIRKTLDRGLHVGERFQVLNDEY